MEAVELNHLAAVGSTSRCWNGARQGLRRDNARGSGRGCGGLAVVAVRSRRSDQRLRPDSHCARRVLVCNQLNGEEERVIGGFVGASRVVEAGEYSKRDNDTGLSEQSAQSLPPSPLKGFLPGSC
jgi:hypothetical protein